MASTTSLGSFVGHADFAHFFVGTRILVGGKGGRVAIVAYPRVFGLAVGCECGLS